MDENVMRILFQYYRSMTILSSFINFANDNFFVFYLTLNSNKTFMKIIKNKAFMHNNKTFP